MLKNLAFISCVALIVACSTGGAPMPGDSTIDLGGPAESSPTLNGPRLMVAADGTITDKLLDGQACQWMTDAGCNERCFPVEQSWCAMDGSGTYYQYTEQALFAVYAYGRITTLQDANCGGQSTQQLVIFTVVTDAEKQDMQMPQSCDGKYDYSENLFDRQWYKTSAATIQPASTTDLPTAS